MWRGLALSFFLAFLPLTGQAAWSNNLELPAAAPVVDEAQILSGQEAAQLTRLVETIKARSGVEISVFIASSLRERAIEEFSLAVAEAYKLGKKKDDKGLIFVVAPKERKMRFEVGYGLEGDLTDAFTRQVLDNQVRPYFKDGQYYEGILAGISAIQQKVPLGLSEEQAPPPRQKRSPINPIGFLILLVVFIVATRLFGFGPAYSSRYRGGGWGGGGGFGGGGGWGGGGGGFGGGGSSSSW
jgi:uncharacterized protein